MPTRALIALLLLAACDARPIEQAPPQQPEPSVTKAPDETASPGADDGEPAEPVQTTITGVLDEAAFAKLHTLTGEAAPPAKGVTIELAGGKGYLSLPADASAPLPAIIVIHEWWGLNEHIRHWTDRLAEAGYAALAVDLYGGQVATDRETALQLMKSAEDKAAHATLAAAHAFLAEDARVGATKRGVIGWCFGGGWALKHALATDTVDAAVIYYGQLETDPKALAKLKAPVLGIFGNADTGIPPAAVDAFEAAMTKAGKSLTVHRYDDAPHAFANPSSGRYVPDAAEDAWSHTHAFFATHMK